MHRLFLAVLLIATCNFVWASPPLRQAPQPSFPEPIYPEAERRQGITGTTLLLASIDAAGNLTGLVVSQSSGNLNLDNAAIDWVKAAKVTPAYDNGNPVPSKIRIPVVFGSK